MDATEKIYRIECSLLGLGPYNHPDESDDLDISAARCAIPWPRPSPWDDGHSMSRDDRSGFSNMRDLIWWFAGAFDKLRAAGYVLAIYEAPTEAVTHLTRQVAFDHTRARQVEIKRIP